jgi:hypothetical protein
VIAATVPHATIAEVLEAVFSVRAVPRLCNQDQLPLLVSCDPVKGDSLEAAVGEFSPGLTAEGSTSCSLQSGVSVRWSPACEDVSPEAGKRPPLEAVTEQRD